MRLILLFGLLGCAPKVSSSAAPQAATLSPSANVYLRSSLDTDPSSYLGRFVPDGEATPDEGSAMTLACSRHISWRFVEGGGVRYNEILAASAEASARLGVPAVASGSGQGSASSAARVQYTLTGKMIAEIKDPAAFADCCREQPDQCSSRYIGEFLQGTGAIYHQADRQVGAQGAGLDPSSGASGGLEVSHGTQWERAVEFPQPVYFAFKVANTPYQQRAQASACDGWMDKLPAAAGGRYVLGASGDARSEQAARNRALANAQSQAMTALGAAWTGDPAQLPPEVAALRAEDWCVETLPTDKGERYTAKVLAFLPESAGAAAVPAPALAPEGRAPAPVPAPAAPARPGAGRPRPGLEIPVDPVPVVGDQGPRGPAMPEPAFAGLLAAVQGASFADDQLDLIRAAAAENRFTMAQVARLLPALSFDESRVEAVRILRAQIVDPQNAHLLAEHLSFSSSREEVMGLFQ